MIFVSVCHGIERLVLLIKQEIKNIPFMIQNKEQGLSVGNKIMLGRNLCGQIQPTGKAVNLTRSIFAYKILHLPDQMNSLNLVGNTESERLAEILNQSMHLITNLSKHRGVAFALRYHSNPQKGEIGISLIVRVIAPEKQISYFPAHLSADVISVWSSFGYSLDPVLSGDELQKVLYSNDKTFFIEVRQHEELAAMIHGDAYVMHPYKPRPATWIPICKTMLQQLAPTILNIHLQPAELFAEEYDLFSRSAQLAESLSDMQFDGYLRKERMVDPVARVVGRLYADYIRRFTEPFLLVAQVASSDPIAAQNVARAFASEVTEPGSFNNIDNNQDNLPYGYDLFIPRSEAEFNIAKRCFDNLDFITWGSDLAGPGQERLPYLVDAYTAAAVFRFPVPIRGGLPGIRTKQDVPDYDVGPRSTTLEKDEILVGDYADRGGIASVPLRKLNSHLLIAGTTGSGKTTTSMHILAQLWEKGIPFLVIEPAKTEYRSLMFSSIEKDLQVFSLGDESLSPFRINPLEIMPGVKVETHISYLRACFEAALPTFGILPSLIEDSLHSVYLDKGWDLTDKGHTDNIKTFPTLGELYFEIIRSAEERGYSEKTLQDIRAAAAGRISSLLKGSKGRMLNTRYSIPMNQIMNKPTILELESLNDDEKALVIMFILTAIREYCLTTRNTSALQHVTVIEEAHRVMANTSHVSDRETSADTRAQAVGMFSNVLSEVRAFGEGLIIAEQIPNRLAEDALKNTNTKIIHRLPGMDDREAIGGAMNLGEEQKIYLSKMKNGQAAFYTEGFEQPVFVTIPNFKDEAMLPEKVMEQQVEDHMSHFHSTNKDIFLPFGGCAFCRNVCRYRDRIARVAYDVKAREKFQKALWAFEQERKVGNNEEGWKKIIDCCQEEVVATGIIGDINAAFCYFTHLWSFDFTEGMAENIFRIGGE